MGHLQENSDCRLARYRGGLQARRLGPRNVTNTVLITVQAPANSLRSRDCKQPNPYSYLKFSIFQSNFCECPSHRGFSRLSPPKFCPRGPSLCSMPALSKLNDWRISSYGGGAVCWCCWWCCVCISTVVVIIILITHADLVSPARLTDSLQCAHLHSSFAKV